MAAHRLILAAALAVGLAASPAARGEGRPGYGGELVASLTSAPQSLDPVAARSHAEVMLVGLVFDALYRLAPDGTVVPHLARALPVLERGGAAARIAVRAGVTFHDGRALGAADVVASLRRALASGGALAVVTRVDRDGADVVVELGAAAPDLAAALALPQASVTPGGVAPGERAIGSGPFAVARLDRAARRLTLRAHDAHFAGRPYLDGLTLDWFVDAAAEARRYEIGDAAISTRGVAAFAGHAPAYLTTEVEGAATLLTYVGFGGGRAEVTGDLDLRRALHLALARGGLAGLGLGERLVPTASPIPVDLDGAALPAAAAQGQLVAARAALAAAAARVPALAEARRGALALTVLVDETRLDDREVGERVVRALAKLGVGATLVVVSAADFAARLARGTAELFIGQLATTTARPTLAYLSAFEAGGDGWARARLARGTLTAAAAATEFAARLPIVPLLHRAVRYHLRGDVRGAAVDLAGRLGLADLFLHGAPPRRRAPR